MPELYVTPEMYGAVGDGLADDTAAMQTAINNGSSIVLTQKYRITDTIHVGTHKGILFLGNTQVIADCGEKDLFSMTCVNCVSFHAIGGGEPNITGTCNAVFHLKGVSPIHPGNYSKRVSFDNLWVSSGDTINIALYMDTLTRQVNVHNCTFYCKNAIFAEGKHVEICIDNSLIWSTAPDGSAIRLTSALGGEWYSEGWMISNCTIDTSYKSSAYGIHASDFMVLQVSNCYIGSRVKLIGPRTTTHSYHITFTGNVIGHDMILDNDGGTDPDGNLFYAMITGNDFVKGRILLEPKSYYVTITGNQFIYCRQDNTTKAAIIAKNGCTRLTINGIFADDTYTDGVVIITGQNGNDILVSNINYNGNGTPVWSDRPIRESNTGNNNTDFVILKPGSHARGTMCILTFKAAKGSNGMITGRINFDGDGIQKAGYLEVATGDLVVPKAPGHGNYFQLTEGQKGMTFSIPYHCDKTGEYKVRINNASDAVMKIDYHSCVAVTRE